MAWVWWSTLNEQWLKTCTLLLYCVCDYNAWGVMSTLLQCRLFLNMIYVCLSYSSVTWSRAPSPEFENGRICLPKTLVRSYVKCNPVVWQGWNMLTQLKDTPCMCNALDVTVLFMTEIQRLSSMSSKWQSSWGKTYIEAFDTWCTINAKRAHKDDSPSRGCSKSKERLLAMTFALSSAHVRPQWKSKSVGVMSRQPLDSCSIDAQLWTYADGMKGFAATYTNSQWTIVNCLVSTAEWVAPYS